MRVSTCNVTTSRQTSVQLGQNIVPVEDNNHTLEFTTISNDNARDARNYELEKPLAPRFEDPEIINNNSITKSGTLWL